MRSSPLFWPAPSCPRPSSSAGFAPSHRPRPGYWAVHAYQAAITGQTAALARPLSMMAVFGVAGLLSGIALR